MEKQVLGVIHGAQPTIGSPKFYNYFKLGSAPFHDGEYYDGTVNSIADRTFGRIIGQTPNEFSVIASALPGAIQLGPSDEYTANGTKYDWLTWDNNIDARINSTIPSKQLPGGRYIYNGNDMYSVYTERSGTVGMLPNNFDNDRRDDFQDYCAEAKAFHNSVDSYSHPLTFQIILNNHDSWSGCNITQSPGGDVVYNAVDSREGDRTVPVRSANYLSKFNGNRLSGSRRSIHSGNITVINQNFNRVNNTDDNDHQNTFVRNDVIDYVVGRIDQIINWWRDDAQQTSGDRIVL
jgi:hypothetical protein